MSEITIVLPNWFLITFTVFAGISIIFKLLNFIMDVLERKTK